MKLIVIVLIVILTLSSCNGQSANKGLKLTDFKFESIFGTTDLEPDNTYCLLGTGFFRAHSSNDSDSLINDWIRNHSNAKVVAVSSFGPVETENPDSRMIYCWVIEKQDTLNNYLIKNGCFPGGTMMKPDESKRSVSKRDYKSFIEQIKAAELYAREQKIRIWKE